MITVQAFLDQKGQQVHTMGSSETVFGAARMMTERGIGCVVVTEGKEAIGIFTERDMVQKVVVEKRSPEETQLSDVMSSPVTTCQLEDTLRDCALVMQEKQIRRLPVVLSGNLVGIVTSRDLVKSQLSNKDATIADLVQHIFTLQSARDDA